MRVNIGKEAKKIWTHDRCLDEVAYRVEEDQRLLHTALIQKTGYQERKEYKMMETYHAFILVQYLILLAQADQERKRRNILDPLLLLASLTTDIMQFIRQLADLERRPQAAAQDILADGEARGQCHVVEALKWTMSSRRVWNSREPHTASCTAAPCHNERVA